MALNPYTLYSLYDKGILEYVPTDLAGGTPMGAMMPMSNPYLDMAQQGGLYQNHGMSCDSFQITSPYANIQGSTTGITQVQPGALTNTGVVNSFLGNNVGVYSQAGVANSFGFNGTIGSQTNAGIANSFGIQSSISNGVNKTMSIIDRTPKFVLGLVAGAIGLTAIVKGLKHGKKPKTTSFWSKLNPLNWFKKKK